MAYRTLAAFVGILLLAGMAYGQVSYDGNVEQECNLCISMNRAHTGNSAADRRALSGVSIYDASAEGFVTGSITYGAGTMSFVDRQVSADGQIKSELFTLATYPTGAQTVEWNFDNPVRAVAGVATVSNLDATTPLGTVAKATDTVTAPSVTCDSTAGDLVLDIVAASFVPTVGAGQTENWNLPLTNEFLQGASSRETATGTSTVMSWSVGSPDTWSSLCVALKPPAVAAARRSWEVVL